MVVSKQGILSYRIEQESASPNLTALGGLAPYLDLMCGSGLIGSIRRNLAVRDGDQGWTDTQIVTSLILLNLAGGDCVDDLERLNADEGFSKLVSRCERHGLGRRGRREMDRRWRKARTRSVVSPSVARRYLSAFHDQDQEKLRIAGKAFIPEAGANVLGLRRVNADLLWFAQRSNKQMMATLDLDATLIETSKAEALYCYKGFGAYQPLNIYWAEQGMMLHPESFRERQCAGRLPATACAGGGSIVCPQGSSEGACPW